MTLRPREVELMVERPSTADGSGERVHLVARFEVAAGADGPSPQDLAQALDRLRADLDTLVGPSPGPSPAARPDRDLAELVDTYHPRQRQLIDLLRDEGGLTVGEHELLVEYLAGAKTSPPRSAPVMPMVDAPLAAAPILAERLPDRARPVPELLRTFQIESLRQAGAVRARRQISFEEYMALKRHFESRPEGTDGRATGAGPTS
ncbi:MAG: hypothetical protein L3K02_01735 [Thermoplasmata archaeon]|nr:hypothetical protein [Thermoplasmata archaeon]